jgi:hypothetical protein
LPTGRAAAFSFLAMMKFVFWLYVGVMLVSCKSDDVQSNNFSLVPFDTTRIQIDTATGHYLYDLHLSQPAATELLSFFNPHNYSLYLYNWRLRKHVASIVLQKDGNNGVGYSELLGHALITDNLFLVYNPDSRKLFKVNVAGEVLKSYDLKTASAFQNSFSLPVVCAFSPMVVLDSANIVLLANAATAKPNAYQQTYCAFRVHLSDSLLATPFLPYPKIYDQGNWGDYLPYIHYSTLSSTNNKLISSFPRSDSIVITNLSSLQTKSKWVGSAKFSEQSVKPLSYDSHKEWPDRDEQILYDFTTPSFSHVVYDGVNHMYYRLCFSTPPSKSVIAQNNGNFRIGQGLSVIAMDSAFNKLCETTLPTDTYNGEVMFASNGVLYFLLKASRQDQEDRLQFHGYKLEKVQK